MIGMVVMIITIATYPQGILERGGVGPAQGALVPRVPGRRADVGRRQVQAGPSQRPHGLPPGAP